MSISATDGTKALLCSEGLNSQNPRTPESTSRSNTPQEIQGRATDKGEKLLSGLLKDRKSVV